MGRQEYVSRSSVQLGDIGIPVEPAHLEEALASQGIPVGVQARGRQAEKHVSRIDRLAVNQLRAIHGTNDEPREVVFGVGVEAWHLGCLSADQRASVLAAGPSYTGHDLFGD